MLHTILPMATLVILLVWMGFFMLGSLPLMILKHDTPMDARFIRGLFDVYYKAVITVAIAGAIAHAVGQRTVTSIGLAVIACIALVSRQMILSRMDGLRQTMTPTDADGIRSFRKLHVTGMALNFAQLALIGFSLPRVL